ncbi:hypothetical protein N9A70_04065 [Akkermansiaceae bacterium]|nr:hypothetical protein [Akkermansiaceae bacterium]
MVKILVDPTEQTADANKANNVWPPQIKEEPFTLERKNESFNNEMKRAREKKAAEDKKKAEAKKKQEAEKKAAGEKAKAEKEKKAKNKGQAKNKAEPAK